MIDLPIKFDQKLREAGAANGLGYPYQISAGDLMANFEYAALDADDSWIEPGSGFYGSTRKLKLPVLPAGGTHVLSCVGGTLQWIETEEC
jgi:hypothetical protein